MDHAAPQQLDPAGVPAGPASDAVAHEAGDRQLPAGLDEREVVGREAGADLLAEHRPGERGERPAEIGHRQALVDREALDLVEHRHVRGVGRVVLPNTRPGAIT